MSASRASGGGWSPAGLLMPVPDAGSEQAIALSELRPGVNVHGDALIKVAADGGPEWVISRTCDHAGGTLALAPDGRTAVCPLHRWCLDLDRLAYTNGGGSKRSVAFRIEDDTLHYRLEHRHLEIPGELRTAREAPLELRFLAHACVMIEYAGFRVIADPWLVGPCFSTGWWHEYPPKSDALELLAGADAVFLSHNHPDHMHPETLAHVSRDIPILVPAFESESALRSARALGFRRVHDLSFNTVYGHPDTPLSLAVLQAGSGRDDSALLAIAGDRTVLLAVDSRAINEFVLPLDVDLLFDSFSGGASGYPLCFEHYSMEKRRAISRRHARAVQVHARRLVRTMRPRAYAPYAGFFTVACPEDVELQRHNVKNSMEETRALVAEVDPEATFVDVRRTDRMRIDPDRSLHLDRVEAEPLYRVDAEYIAPYRQSSARAAAGFGTDELCRYFERCDFRSDLVLYLTPTDRDFEPLPQGLRIDFSAAKPVIEELGSGELAERYARASDAPRRLEIRARVEALADVVRNLRSWEELSIGFQCRVRRKPDLYNADFWFHFTNRYIAGVDDRGLA